MTIINYSMPGIPTNVIIIIITVIVIIVMLTLRLYWLILLVLLLLYVDVATIMSFPSQIVYLRILSWHFWEKFLSTGDGDQANRLLEEHPWGPLSSLPLSSLDRTLGIIALPDDSYAARRHHLLNEKQHQDSPADMCVMDLAPATHTHTHTQTHTHTYRQTDIDEDMHASHM